jgi:phosphoglycerate kinase
MHFLSSVDPQDKKVLLRLDLDLPQEKGKFDTSRMEDSFETLSYLWRKKAKHVTVIAHRGHHPKKTKEFSLTPIAELLYDALLGTKAFAKAKRADLEAWLDILENLRFDPREEANDAKFAKELAAGQDLFVNDAFATSHREHASIVQVPKLLETVFGFRFEKEVTVMKKLVDQPKRPFIFVLGGAKLETKLPLLEKISERVDVILLGGKLALEAREQGYKNRKMIIASLTEDTFDIDQKTMEQFDRFICEAKTLVWNGPMGKFEDAKHMAGTKFVAEAVARTTGYRVVGGGDTEAAISLLKIDEKKSFNFVSSGGGAMMQYLADRTLVGITAAEPIVKKKKG